MTLKFPNQCRSFETAKKCIRFWGYDSIVEITFFIEPNAIAKLFPKAGSDEKTLLHGFDQTVDRIHQVARRMYEQNRIHSCVYVLTANDF